MSKFYAFFIRFILVFHRLQRKLWKVMFSQESVCPWGGRVSRSLDRSHGCMVGYPLPSTRHGIGIPYIPPDMGPGHPTPLLLTHLVVITVHLRTYPTSTPISTDT